VLPTIEEIDAHLEGADGPLARLRAAERCREQLAELTERAGRARCLAMLELYESLGGRGRYHRVALAAGVTMNRVSQLLADARLWRQHDALLDAETARTDPRLADPTGPAHPGPSDIPCPSAPTVPTNPDRVDGPGLATPTDLSVPRP